MQAHIRHTCNASAGERPMPELAVPERPPKLSMYIQPQTPRGASHLVHSEAREPSVVLDHKEDRVC